MTMVAAQKTFLEEVEKFLKDADMTASEFGWAAVHDPNLVRDLRRGRSPSLALADRVRAFITAHKEGRVA